MEGGRCLLLELLRTDRSVGREPGSLLRRQFIFSALFLFHCFLICNYLSSDNDYILFRSTIQRYVPATGQTTSVLLASAVCIPREATKVLFQHRFVDLYTLKTQLRIKRTMLTLINLGWKTWDLCTSLFYWQEKQLFLVKIDRFLHSCQRGVTHRITAPLVTYSYYYFDNILLSVFVFSPLYAISCNSPYVCNAF